MSRGRFTIHIVQSAAAIVLAGMAIASFFTAVFIPIPITERNKLSIITYDGRTRLFWIQSTEDPIDVKLMGDGPNLRIAPWYPWPAMLPPSMVGVDIPRKQWFRIIPISGYRNVPSFGGVWRAAMAAPSDPRPPAYSSFVRFPTWILCVVLLYPPIVAIIRGARERYRKRNHLCETCGYVLYALTEPRCPECGTAYERTVS